MYTNHKNDHHYTKQNRTFFVGGRAKGIAEVGFLTLQYVLVESSLIQRLLQLYQRLLQAASSAVFVVQQHLTEEGQHRVTGGGAALKL